VQSLSECRALYQQVMGTRPPHFPIPSWLFERCWFVGRDLTTMWRWLRTGAIDLDTAPTRMILPEARTVQSWLSEQKASEAATS
jgi:hypothetical protein